MDLKQVLKLKEHLSKSTQNESVLLDLLQQLQSLKATQQILKDSRIGITVNDLRKSSNFIKVKESAKQLIQKWKQDVESCSHQSTPSESPSTPIDSATSSQHLQERTLASDRLSLSSTGDKIRDKCIELLYSPLATGSDLDSHFILKLATKIELFTFKEFQSAADGKYKSRIRSLVSNLKDKNNPDLRNSILDGTCSCEKFSKMTPEEMMSKDLKKKVEEAIKVSIHEAVSAADNQSETDMFKCGKCKQRKTKYYQMQTRSADEPMTTFVTCLNCGNRWKFC